MKTALVIFAAALAVVVAFNVIYVPVAQAYWDWLFGWYNPEQRYEEVYREKTEELGKSAMAADSDARFAAAFLPMAGSFLILVIICGGAAFLGGRGMLWLIEAEAQRPEDPDFDEL